MKIPAALLVCAADPVPPVNPDGRAAAYYILDLWAAGEDCRGHLAAIATLQGSGE